MVFTSRDLKAVITEARPIVERQLDDAELIAGLREAVTAKGGDWSQVKALVKAMIQDERDEAGGNKRVLTILSKAGNAIGYADMLGLTKLNEKNSFEPEHDADGVIIESQAKASEDNAITDDGRAADTDGPGDASRLSASGGTGAPIRRMSMTPLEPCEANGLKGFGFTVRFDEPEAAMLPQTGGVETLVAAGAPEGEHSPYASAPITDRTKPNPWCLDPDECGLTSWTHFCLRCQRVKAEVESAAAA